MFKSSLPDQSFQADKLHFWFSVYSSVDGIVTVKSSGFSPISILKE